MGEYLQEQYEKVAEENYKEEFEILETKKFFSIPILVIKQSDTRKLYMLFNLIPIFEINNF
ncbi:hypothetical protein IJI31_04255 [bacterium]|nr:hypothetical protein [bacterium]